MAFSPICLARLLSLFFLRLMLSHVRHVYCLVRALPSDQLSPCTRGVEQCRHSLVCVCPISSVLVLAVEFASELEVSLDFFHT